MRYAIVIEKAKTNYSAYIPDVPGCVATGKTLQEVKQHMKDALEFHLEGMLQDGEPWPESGSRCGYADVDVAAVKKLAGRENRKSSERLPMHSAERKSSGPTKARNSHSR